ncbi:MAG TPA: hypothetical protein VHK63_06645 [Candidatus Limnocylindria bacterium]|nr:hypothetical protein [Candidatus Limnocylindria bacterium]
MAAMERSLDLGAPEGQVYAELAYQTSQRQGMWKRRLDRALVNEWIDRALRSAREGTPPKVRAMVAKASWQNDLEAGLEALRLADSLEDDGLRSAALHPVQVAFEARGDLDEAWRHAQLRAELLPSITDPDHVADTLMGLIDLQLNIGRIAQARAGVVTLEDTVAGLTPHHRVHGLGTRVRLHAAIGEWEAVRALTPQAEEWIELNLATPCPFNVGSMLLAASAMTYGSDRAEADRLVAKAESIGMVGYEEFMTPRWLLLAIAQRNQAVLRRTVDSITADSLTAGAWDLVAVWLDALSELGDRDRIEAEAPKWIRPDGYAAAFAVKALGVARRDPGLLKEAAKRFESMGITWHAARAREASAHVGAG